MTGGTPFQHRTPAASTGGARPRAFLGTCRTAALLVGAADILRGAPRPRAEAGTSVSL